MSDDFDLQAYLSEGIENFMKDVVRATLKNPRESAFMLRFAAASAAASQKRKTAEKTGEHIPSFLIASITSKCNLHCAGCYSRCNHATVDEAPVSQLTGEEWLKIFGEAEELGISFILLAGGEPMLHRDIIEAAGKRPNILLPIFTNGTFISLSGRIPRLQLRKSERNARFRGLLLPATPFFAFCLSILSSVFLLAFDLIM